jgi:hypothetical protein
MTALVFTVILLAASACTPLQVDEPDMNHPANPDAMAAPVEKIPGTLDVEAVEAPEQLEDPHAGHMMH